jgi:serine/threonine protein kinase/WD40 repeat protein
MVSSDAPFPQLAIAMPEPIDPTRTSDPPAEPPTGTAHTRSHDRDPATATADSATGQPRAEPLEVLPGFDIIREIGSGGMGVVYEARQTRLNRLVALKVLRGGRAETKDLVRFLAEAEAVAAIRHPNVVQVYETSQEAGRPYMVLELLTGGTLADRLQAGKLTPREAASLVAKLADAVQAAHELGIVHRDLKPSNILFSGGEVVRSRDGEQPTTPPPHDLTTPKITDFGLAKRAGGVDLTRTQAVMGTPAYMAPEQAKGEGKFVGPAADVWALGAILYECLTGKRPFDADETFAVLRKVIEEPPARPRTHTPGLPRDLELIALKCLEKRPADRYPSAAALADDLERFLAGKPVSVRPAGSIERFTKWVRRNPAVAGATAAVALALVAGTAVSLAFGLQARRRGEELAKTNDNLTASQKEVAATNEALQALANMLVAKNRELIDAQIESEERGYLSDVALAHQLWKANDLAGMRTALERCPPERRKWEWHYLKGLSRPERAEHITDSPPLALAYSPDGKFLVYTTFAGTLTVLDVNAVHPRHTILGPADPSNRTASIAFHPEGRELAYVVNGRVRVVELATGKWRELTDPKQPDGNPGNHSSAPSIAVGYTPEGKLLAAAIDNGRKPNTREFTIRDTATGKPVRTFLAFEQPMHAWGEVAYATFSPDGKLFASSTVDSGIRVRGADEPAMDEPFRPEVKVWDIESGELLRKTGGGGVLLGQISFGPASSVLFGRRGEAISFGREHGSEAPPYRYFPGHAGDVVAVAAGPDGLVWSGGEDKFIRAHTWARGLERFVLRGCTRTVLRLAVSPDGKEVAAAVGEIVGPGGAVYRFGVSSQAADEWRAGVLGGISVVSVVAPDGSRFAACGFRPFDDRPESFRLVTREVATGKERIVTPAGLWLRGTFAPDGRLFVVERAKPLDRHDHIRIVEPDGKLGPVITLPAGDASEHATAVTCTRDGRTLAAVTASTTDKKQPRAHLLTVDTETRNTRELGGADFSDLLPPKPRFPTLLPLGLVIDRDGKRLAATFALGWEIEGQSRHELRGVLVVWDLTTGKELFRKQTAVPLYAAAFDSRGRVAAAGGSPAGGVVFGWDVGTGEQWLSVRSHTRPILAMAFGPDDRLATGGADRLVKLWDIASKREVLTFDGFSREVGHLAFTADGKSLVAGTGLDLLAAASVAGVPTDWPPAEVRVFRTPK